MKKILSFTLVVLMLCAASLLPASAQDRLTENFYDYCVEKLGEDSLYDGAGVIITDSIEYGGQTYFTASGWVEPENTGTFEVIGDYCVHNTASFHPYELGVYVAANDRIYDLKTAYEQVPDVVFSVICGLQGVSVHKIQEGVQDIDIIHNCINAFNARYMQGESECSYMFCRVFATFDEYTVFRAYCEDVAYPAMETEEQISYYTFHYGYPVGIGSGNSVGIYVMDNEGQVCSLYDAYESGMIEDMDAIALAVGKGVTVFADDLKYVEEVMRLFRAQHGGSGEGDFTLTHYSERYEYYSPENTATGDEATPDYVLLSIDTNMANCMPWADMYGDYILFTSSGGYPFTYGYGIYIPETQELMDLSTAIDRDLEGIEKVFTEARVGRLIGDMDRDRKITVKDATYIQKILVGMDGFTDTVIYAEGDFPCAISDFNRDEIANIKDATAIQKAVAGLEYK